MAPAQSCHINEGHVVDERPIPHSDRGSERLRQSVVVGVCEAIEVPADSGTPELAILRQLTTLFQLAVDQARTRSEVSRDSPARERWHGVTPPREINDHMLTTTCRSATCSCSTCLAPAICEGPAGSRATSR